MLVILKSAPIQIKLNDARFIRFKIWYRDAVREKAPLHQAVRVIDNPDVLRLIADPTRLRILTSLRQRALTVKELADLLEVPRTRLYYHLGLLEEHDLIGPVDLPECASGGEKFYRTTAFRLSVAKSMFGNAEGPGSPVDTFLSLVLDEVGAEIRRAVAAGLIDIEQSREDVIQPRHLVLGRRMYRLTDEDLIDLEARFAEIRTAFEHREAVQLKPGVVAPTDGDLYELLVGFYPVACPEPGDSYA